MVQSNPPDTPTAIIYLTEGEPWEDRSTITFISTPSSAGESIKPVSSIGRVGANLSHCVISQQLASKFPKGTIDNDDKTLIFAGLAQVTSEGKIWLKFTVPGIPSVLEANFYILPDSLVKYGKLSRDPSRAGGRTDYDVIFSRKVTDAIEATDFRPVSIHQPMNESLAGAECVICQESFQIGQTVITLQCQCPYWTHESCLFAMISIYPFCPLCSSSVRDLQGQLRTRRRREEEARLCSFIV